MAVPGSFPLLVEGSWGPDPPKNLSTKLQMYFQSPKRSGGGECEVRQDPESPSRFLVLFYPEDGKRRWGTHRSPGVPPSSGGCCSGGGQGGGADDRLISECTRGAAVPPRPAFPGA
ncbi:hypothetical protein P7K49_031033 [Saguinus oedipus]|uniref:PAR14-like first RRM domain-containing protein n=1 Tax=Saguinus oedipus TaxID=9490 RepID=A0ABQ9U4R5_SAGOE|nr:hypothetical protein P7K49_031033 [Saguinus oedipus]